MDEDQRWTLGQNLERDTKKLQARMQGHFVDDHSICSSCKNATITRQASKNSRSITCAMLGKVPLDITECSDYAAIGSLSLTQMSEIAILIDSKEKRVGFQGGE